MRLTREASAILGKTSIGMLALRSGRLPLVNPAVFSFAGGSVWMTTSRYAAKTIIAKRDPRAAFLVDGGSKAVLLRGAIEVFDPLNLSNDIRAVLEGPGYFLGMAGYALRNAPFFAGYALDIMRLSRALPAAAATLEGADAPSEAERLFNGRLIAALTAFAEAAGRGTLKTRDDQADVVLAAAAVTGLAVLARAGRLKTLGLDEGALLERLEKHFTPVS